MLSRNERFFLFYYKRRRKNAVCVPTLPDPSTGSGASGVLAAHLMIWATGFSSLPLYTHINSSDIRGGMCHYSKSFWEISIATNHRRKDSFFPSRNCQVSLSWRPHMHPLQRGVIFRGFIVSLSFRWLYISSTYAWELHTFLDMCMTIKRRRKILEQAMGEQIF